MSAYLVSIVVSDPDDEVARRLAEAITELAAEMVGLGDGDTDTFVSDPVQVVR